MFRGLFRLQTIKTSSVCRCALRSKSTEAPQLTEGEQKILKTLKTKFPKAQDVQVQDISGGCGAMYEIFIESIEFSGKKTVMQHRMVNEALKDEIKDMHGLRVSTKVPS